MVLLYTNIVIIHFSFNSESLVKSLVVNYDLKKVSTRYTFLDIHAFRFHRGFIVRRAYARPAQAKVRSNSHTEGHNIIMIIIIILISLTIFRNVSLAFPS